ncbi:MAG TPA: FAD-dependent oxidoreductase, partial [Accumulibacter sp.]|nr:FAD-dependent oxidoreductase [Accumulibacter sp.]
MSQIIEAKVPDIGDYHDVPVIDICVQPGDAVQVDDALVTLESDKATMDVPSSVAGVVKEIRVQLGDKVSAGSVVVLIETADVVHPVAAATAPAAVNPAVPPVAANIAADVECDMLVLGAGPGGYSAAFRSADLGMRTVLVERYPTLGGVCLNVGCIPSKALLHVAGVMEEAQHMSDCGVTFAPPTIDLDRLRAHKDAVVGKLTGGLAGMAKGRKVDVVHGVGQFLDAHHLEVALAAGGRKIVRFA